jgi:hypothetical protein
MTRDADPQLPAELPQLLTVPIDHREGGPVEGEGNLDGY